MNTKIKVDGMHCNACIMHIRMELEENGFEKNIDSITLFEDNQGEVVLSNINEEDKIKIEGLINILENYEVIN